MFHWLRFLFKKPINIMRGDVDASSPSADAYLYVSAKYNMVNITLKEVEHNSTYFNGTDTIIWTNTTSYTIKIPRVELNIYPFETFSK